MSFLGFCIKRLIVYLYKKRAFIKPFTTLTSHIPFLTKTNKIKIILE